MKCGLKIFLFGVLFISKISAQGTWIQKTSMPCAPREGAIGFSIGNKGYIGAGLLSSELKAKDFWEFDPTSNLWTQKADIPTGRRCEAIGFSIGSKGYVGFGANNGEYFNDFLEYDPTLNQWISETNTGISARYGSVSFVIGNKGYVTNGFKEYTINGCTTNETWEFDQGSNSWSQKANFPGIARSHSSAFRIGGTGYVGLGIDSTGTCLQDFWKYDPISNQWTQISNFPGQGRAYAISFAVNGFGFIGNGFNFLVSLSDFYSYDPINDTWNISVPYGGGLWSECATFNIGQKVYVGTGTSLNGNTWSLTNELWEFSSTTSVNELEPKIKIAVYPNPCTSGFLLGIASEKEVSLLITNELGQKIFQEKFVH